MTSIVLVGKVIFLAVSPVIEDKELNTTPDYSYENYL